MKRALFSFVGSASELNEAIIPAFQREREDDEVIEFLEDLAGDACYVPTYLEAQLG
jgi:hypothetical protein